MLLPLLALISSHLSFPKSKDCLDLDRNLVTRLKGKGKSYVSFSKGGEDGKCRSALIEAGVKAAGPLGMKSLVLYKQGWELDG